MGAEDNRGETAHEEEQADNEQQGPKAPRYAHAFPGAPMLSTEQEKWLGDRKVRLRVENEKYLRAHPEIKFTVDEFMRTILEVRPRNVPHFCGEFFTDPSIKEKVALTLVENAGLSLASKKKEKEQKKEQKEEQKQTMAEQAEKSAAIDDATLRSMMRVTKFEEIEVEHLYDVFHASAKDGRYLDLDAFVSCFFKLLPKTVVDEMDINQRGYFSTMVEFFFRLFDRFGDNNGMVEYHEFALGLSMFCRGSKEEKLQNAFRILDRDLSGYIEKDEMIQVLKPFYVMVHSTGSSADDGKLMSDLKRNVDAMFLAADSDNDGRISSDEFMSFLRQDPKEAPSELFQILDMFQFKDPEEEERREGRSLGGEISRHHLKCLRELVSAIQMRQVPADLNAKLDKLEQKYEDHFIRLGYARKSLTEHGRNCCDERQVEILMDPDPMELFVKYERGWQYYAARKEKAYTDVARRITKVGNLSLMASQDLLCLAQPALAQAIGLDVENIVAGIPHRAEKLNKFEILVRQPTLAVAYKPLPPSSVDVPGVKGFPIPGGCIKEAKNVDTPVYFERCQLYLQLRKDPSGKTTSQLYGYQCTWMQLMQRLSEEAERAGWTMVSQALQNNDMEVSLLYQSGKNRVGIFLVGQDGEILMVVSKISSRTLVLIPDGEGGQLCETNFVASEQADSFRANVKEAQGLDPAKRKVTLVFSPTTEDGDIEHIYHFDVTTVLDLHAAKKVSNINGIDSLRYLKELDISNTHVKDLMPLSGLEGLQIVKANNLSRGFTNLDEDPVSIMPLSNLRDLAHIEFNGTRIGDYSFALKDKAKLRVAKLNMSEIDDLSWLASSPNLETLHISGCRDIVSLEDLSHLEFLEDVDIDRLPITDYNPLGTLSKLKRLNMRFSSCKSLDFLRSCTYLSHLFASCSGKLIDVSSLFGKIYLEAVDLSYTQLKDVSAFLAADMTTKTVGIRSLDLTSTSVKDLRPLSRQDKLVELKVGGTKVESVVPLENLKNLHTLDLSNTPFVELNEVEVLGSVRVLILPDHMPDDLVDKVRRRMPNTAIHHKEEHGAGAKLLDIFNQ